MASSTPRPVSSGVKKNVSTQTRDRADRIRLSVSR
jgi:hypothetical protein